MAKAAQKSKPKEPEIEFFYGVEQRSVDWFDLRRGIPTASKFSAIMADGKNGEESLSRQRYMELLAGETLSGKTAETFQSEEMRRGVDMEPVAREHYAKSRFDVMKPVGFVRRRLPSGRYVGASPDSQVGEKRGLEIKTMAPHLIVALLANGPAGGFPSKHRAQLQGTMMVTGWEEMDLVLFYEGMYAPTFTVMRDEAYIKELSDAVEVFDFDLHRLVAKVKGMAK
jgi:YqaJ-like viral recombinase domain